MGGAINFITTAPTQTSLALTYGGGNFGSYQDKLDGTYVNPHLSERFAAARDFSDGFMTDRDYRADLGSSETWFKDAAGAADFLIGTNDRPYGANQFYGPYNSWECTKGWFTTFRQQLGTQTDAAFGYRRHADEFVLLRTAPSVYENNHIDHSWQAMVHRHDDPHANTTLSYGVEADGDQIASNNLGHHGRNRGSAYVNLDLHSLGRFTLSAGAREEVFDGGLNVFSPAASAGYWLGKGVRLRASTSHGFRLPTFTDLYYTDPTHVDNPYLQPESAWDFEGGADWNNNGRVTASLTVFRSNESNVIDYVRPISGTVYMAQNIDQIKFTGVESSVKFRIATTQQIVLGYTGIASNLQVPTNQVFEYTSSYPSQNASASWQAEFLHQIEARTRVGVIQRYQQTSYPLWDAECARSTGLVRPYVQLSNLSNTDYTEIAGIAMPGRSYVAGLQIVWSRNK
jgi:iron complex outermembrane receptor protein